MSDSNPNSGETLATAGRSDAKNLEKDLIDLVQGNQTVLLATCDPNGRPDSSYAPFWLEDGSFHVYISSLAKHTSNIKRTLSASLMVIEDEAAASHIFARKRVTWACDASLIERDSERFGEVIHSLLGKYGSIMDTLKDMQDFHLFRLDPSLGRLVLGFGAAFAVQGWSVKSHREGGSGHQLRKS